MTLEWIAAGVGALVVGLSLGLLGSGGAILTVPILHYLVGHTEKSAIAESVAIVGIISLVGAAGRARKGGVDLRCVVAFGPASMLGAAAGARVSEFIPGTAQFIALAIVMLAAAFMMLRNAARAPAAESQDHGPRRPLTLALAGFGVGAATGLLGIGGGFLYVPVLVLFGRLHMRLAVGTSLALITLGCAVAFVTLLLTARDHPEIVIDPGTVALFALLGVAGALAGQRVSGRLEQRTLKRAFAWMLFVLAGLMLLREGSALFAGDAITPTEPPPVGPRSPA